MTELEPTTLQELAEALRAPADRKQKILLGGAFSKNSLAGPIEPAEVKISTRKLNQIRQYEPRDLTISVEAGMRYSELAAVVAPRGQMLPLDPPWRDQATIGGIVATNTVGPRRRLYGAVRDQAIGITYASVEGKLAESGGMVVKNVAGLDMLKLLVGSFGTLAAIGMVNFKLAPAPESTRTFVLAFQSAEEAVAARDQILAGVLQPASIDVLNPGAASRVGLEGFCILIRAGGSEAVLRRYATELEGAQAVEGEREEALWRGVEEFVPKVGGDKDSVTVRVSHRLQALLAVMSSAPGPAVARAGNGIAYLVFGHAAEAEEWFKRTAENGWSSIVESASEETKRRLELWPRPGDDLNWMKMVKAKFDPDGMLNPGRLYGRI